MKSKFTPPPWTLVIGKYAGNYEIAEALEIHHGANAFVIASAPELVAALQAIRNMCDAPHWTTERRYRIRDIANIALTKALATEV